MADKAASAGDLTALLETVSKAARQKFGPPGPDYGERLAQLDHALATAKMAVEALFDEDARERHLRDRLEREPSLATIHGHQVRRWVEA